MASMMGWDPPTCVCPTSVLGAQNVPDFTGAEPEEVHLKSLTNLFFFLTLALNLGVPDMLCTWGHGFSGTTGYNVMD